MTTPTSNVDTLIDAMNGAGAIQMEFTTGATGQMHADANRGLHAFDQARSQAQAAVASAAARVTGLRADDTIYPDGKNRLIRETIANAQATVAEKLSHLDQITTIMRGVLTSAALPRVSPGAELVARADAQMMLDGAQDKGVTLARLAARQDDIGALAASNWGHDYLTARGSDPVLAAAEHAAAVGSAIDAAVSSTDPARAAAADYARRVVHLEQARDVLRYGAESVLQELAGR